MDERELLPHLFKTEYRKIISVLCKLFGIVHIEVAEDIANDTFLMASETWGLKGIPSNPVVWLYTVAKNKTRDYLRRNKIFSDKVSKHLAKTELNVEEVEVDLSTQNINDSQLQMIFAVCNPVISKESQVGLALRILCGFGIEEIAEAFLTNKETIAKRLLRAKEKLRAENAVMELPNEKEIPNRLESVLKTIYLLFNEGYYSTTQSKVLRKELCIEAMRLAYFLVQNETTNVPTSNALLSLICFHSSRFAARINEAGEYILYDEQNRDLWDDELISKGNHYLIESARGQVISKYHLEASIAYWHCTKLEPETKWESILQLYNQLLQIEYSPITALNRTYVLSKTRGKQEAIKEAVKLKLNEYHLYHSLLGHLYTDIDNRRAVEYYKMALRLAKTSNDKIIIENYIKNLVT